MASSSFSVKGACSSHASYDSSCDRVKAHKVKLGDEDYYVTFDKIGRATEISTTPPRFESIHDSKLEFHCGLVRSRSKRRVLKYFNSQEVTKAYVRNEEAKIHTEIADIDRYDSLCLSGGGARGFGFSGVFKQLGNDRLANSINDVAGSSIGSLASLIVACGLSADEISEFVANSDIQFTEASIYKNARNAIKFKLQPHVKKISAFLQSEGLPLLDASGKTIKQDCSANALDYLTFKQLELIRSSSSESVLPDIYKLKLKEIVIIATNDVTKEEVELSAINSPNLPLVDAVRASCGYPLKIGSKTIPSSLILNHSVNVGTKASRKKFVSLSDGGSTNNTPHLYLKGKHKLVVAFTTAEQRVARRKLTVSERLVQGVVGVPLYDHERYDIKKACNDSSVSLFFLDSPINSKDLKRATKNFFLIELEVMKQFAEFENSRKVVLRSCRDLPSSEVNLMASIEDLLSVPSEFFGEDFGSMLTTQYVYSGTYTSEELQVGELEFEPTNGIENRLPEQNKSKDKFDDLNAAPVMLDLSHYWDSSSQSSLSSGDSGIYHVKNESISASQSMGSIALSTYNPPGCEGNWLLLEPQKLSTKMVKSRTVPEELTLAHANIIKERK